MRIALPVTPRDHPKAEFLLRINVLHKFMILLATDTQMPDRETCDCLAWT
ncbi:MAG: hypothetical protein MK160_12175 [Rhodobacteraceae bacterium]|nr:hypothetical protein [Paracoccaceae bacterium]